MSTCKRLYNNGKYDIEKHFGYVPEMFQVSM